MILERLLSWQLECNSDFRAIKSGKPPFLMCDTESLEITSRVREQIDSGSLGLLEEHLDNYKWESLPEGVFGRRGPGVNADMAIQFFLDVDENLNFGFYSVTRYWRGPAGPSWVGVTKLRQSIELPAGLTGDEDTNRRAPYLLYSAINSAAQKSRRVLICRQCGRSGPSWEIDIGLCDVCLPRVY